MYEVKTFFCTELVSKSLEPKAISVLRIGTLMKSIIFNYKNAFISNIPLRQMISEILGKSKFSEIYSQSQVNSYMLSEQTEIKILIIFI